MNIIPFVYIFSLYVLFTPGILFKKNNNVIINALLFAIVWYITFDFVERNQEYMSQDMDVDVDGLKDLVDSLNKEINEKVINVDVKNEYITTPATDNSGIIQLCEEKIQEIADYKQQIEDLSTQLASYAGTRELIASLKNTVSRLEEKEAELMKQLDLANETIANQQTTIVGKDDQIEVLDQSIQQKDGTIQTQTETINSKNNKISNLNNNIGQKNSQINHLNNNIGQKNSQINHLNSNIGQLNSNIGHKNNEINYLSYNIGQKNIQINNLQHTIWQQNSEISELNNTIDEKNNELDNCDTSSSSSSSSYNPCTIM
jgi:chromosome segregation ATPase